MKLPPFTSWGSTCTTMETRCTCMRAVRFMWTQAQTCPCGRALLKDGQLPVYSIRYAANTWNNHLIDVYLAFGSWLFKHEWHCSWLNCSWIAARLTHIYSTCQHNFFCTSWFLSNISVISKIIPALKKRYSGYNTLLKVCLFAWQTFGFL